jgi:hypothetical protein
MIGDAEVVYSPEDTQRGVVNYWGDVIRSGSEHRVHKALHHGT